VASYISGHFKYSLTDFDKTNIKVESIPVRRPIAGSAV